MLRKELAIYGGLLVSHSLFCSVRSQSEMWKGFFFVQRDPNISHVEQIARPSAYLVLVNWKVVSVCCWKVLSVLLESCVCVFWWICKFFLQTWS